MWTALYDMLLEWIDPANRFLHTAETELAYTDEDVAGVQMNAYADDLGTITSGPHAAEMQTLQATWLSAFCAFTGLVMHPKKIKPTIVGPIPAEHPTHLRVYDHAWQAIDVEVLPTLATYKYLGVHLDLRNTSHDSFAAVLSDATTRLAHLLQQPASPMAKIDYIRFKIMPIILYTAVCSNWTLKQYRKLDAPFTATYRKILCTPAKAPTAMFYLPQTMAGIGLPRVSDRAQIMKWESFLRCTAVYNDPEASVNAFLGRTPQPAINPEEHMQTLRCPPATQWPRQPLTARSLIEWAGESGLMLALRVSRSTSEQLYELGNHNTIQEKAEFLELVPDQQHGSGPTQFMPLRLFATDGSYTAIPEDMSDIITSESLLRDRGKGAGGIVFVPRDRSATVVGFRITSRNPEPGMNAFTWELLTQTVALQMITHQPTYLPGLSDCTSAIARTNLALRSYINPLAHTRGGLWASGAHVFTNHRYPRKFTHVKAHPERDPERLANPTIRDKAIFMADAVAGQSKQRLGKCDLPVEVHDLVLEDIMNEIIPLRQWHFRIDDEHQVPVLNDIIDYQHRVLLKNMTTSRDRYNDEGRWTSTALSFASTIHPPKDKSFWAATRRALIVFDWIGHGRNRAKTCALHPDQKAAAARCHHCGQEDHQAHCMLSCPHQKFIPIRRTAKIKQHAVAAKLREKYKDPGIQSFIQQICYASWCESPHLSRIWLGTWSMHTLQQLIGQPMDAPLTITNRYRHIAIARDLTEPLLHAYDKMIHINITTSLTLTQLHEPLPLLDTLL